MIHMGSGVAFSVFTPVLDVQVPLMISGPYGYNCAPCELFFAVFKRADINPRKVKINKS